MIEKAPLAVHRSQQRTPKRAGMAMIGHADIARAYVEAGFHVLVFDPRANGRSKGDHYGLGWLERRDVRGAVNLLLSRGFPARKRIAR